MEKPKSIGFNLSNLGQWSARIKIRSIQFTVPAVNTFEIGSDPYCIISLVNPPKDAENLFKTEVVRKETKGTWKVNKEFGVSNASAILKFEVWDWNRLMKHQMIDSGEFRIDGLCLGESFESLTLSERTSELLINFSLECPELEAIVAKKEQEEAAKKNAAEESMKKAEEEFNLQFNELLKNPESENYRIKALEPESPYPYFTREFARTFAKQISSNMNKELANNLNVAFYLLVCSKFNFISPKDILDWVECKAVLNNMIGQDEDGAFEVKLKALLKEYLDSRFDKSHPNFGTLVEVYLGEGSENFVQLGSKLWIGNKKAVVTEDLKLNGNSCQLLEICFEEIKPPLIDVKMSMFMEAMMWVATYYSLAAGTFVKAKTLALWEKVPELLLNLHDSEKDDRELIELLHARGGTFAEVLRSIMVCGHITIEANTLNKLNQVYKGQFK